MNSFSIVIAKTPSTENTRIQENFGQLISPGQGLLLLVCLGSIVLLALLGNKSKKHLATGRFGGRPEKVAAARAARRQMKKRRKNEVAVRILTSARFPFGKSPLYLPDAQRGIAVVGAPGTGKTVSVLDPIAFSVIDQGFPAILYDFKYPTQTSRLVAHAIDRGYDIHIFAPGHPESEVCNPLEFLKHDSDSLMARQLAEIFNQNFKRVNSGQIASEDGFFGPAGDQATEAFLLLAKATPFPDLIMCQELINLSNIVQRILHNRDQIDPWCFKSFSQLISSAKSEKTLSSILATTSLNFTRLLKPEILSSLCGKTTLPLDLKGKKLVILGLDRERRDVLSPLLAAVLHLLVARNVARQRVDPLFLLADEVPSLYLPSLTHWLNENREDGLCTVLGFQNLAQLEKMYGQEMARAILGACGTKVVFNPQDPESARLFSEYLGQKEVRFTQNSRGKNGQSFTEQIQTRPLFEASELLQLPTGRCIILNPHFKQGKSSYIPLLESIRITPQYRAFLDRWQKRGEKLIQRRKDTSIHRKITQEDLRVRTQWAEENFPDKPETRDQKRWQSLL
jgi:type IV secretory pathway TraG/TraD family ATPase VirD4